MAMTLEKASAAVREELMHDLGNPNLTVQRVEELRTIITETGAVAEVEKLIEELATESRIAAQSSAIAADAQPFLLALADSATRRSH
jgi:geranylgeranyl diphosphate synthase type I